MGGLLLGQNTIPGRIPHFKASNGRNPLGTAPSGGFPKGRETPSDASENGKLSYSHAGFDASTLLNGGEGGKGGFDQATAMADGPEEPWGVFSRWPAGGADKTKIYVREAWPPALGPAGDDVFDLDTPG